MNLSILQFVMFQKLTKGAAAPRPYAQVLDTGVTSVNRLAVRPINPRWGSMRRPAWLDRRLARARTPGSWCRR